MKRLSAPRWGAPSALLLPRLARSPTTAGQTTHRQDMPRRAERTRLTCPRKLGTTAAPSAAPRGWLGRPSPPAYSFPPRKVKEV